MNPNGLSPSDLQKIMDSKPLSVGIPSEYGGRGGHIHENLAVLEASSYESLPLALTLGINSALFLQPVAKYGNADIQGPVFARFLSGKSMGGLMITEPGHGTDALNMQTSFSDHGDHYRLAGIKHWSGLTGSADYWLIAAREKTNDGNLRRDVGFFVHDGARNNHEIVVEEYFDSLGLHQIPYGRNRIDARVPKSHRLESKSSGIKIMLDTLHRSRMQFPGMGQGFLRRLLDEALEHCRTRFVGGRSLLAYDKVQDRLARLQASFTICSAMCLQSSRIAATSNDLSARGLEANSIKAVITDLMQDAGQSLLQLVGAKGYRRDHVAGRAIVDSRPFQIFEGSNDVLYAQISETVIKLMERLKQTNLFRFLSGFDLTRRASEYLRELVDFRLDTSLPQRKLVDLGRALGRVVSFDWVLKLGQAGFRADLIRTGLAECRQQIASALGVFHGGEASQVVERYQENGSWFDLIHPSNHPAT